MDKKYVLILVSVLVVTTLITAINVKAYSTLLYVNPPESTVEIFHTFQINISISQVVDLAGWDFKLYYPNSLLNATSITEGPFLNVAGNTIFQIVEFNDNYNATHGRIWAACVLEGNVTGATGNGTLATITFKAKSVRYATLHLAETDLINSKMPPEHITHTTTDGTVTIKGHDIAILNVNPLKTIVGQGFSMHINVTVANQGDFTETFNVTLYANTTAVNQTELTLTSGGSTTVTFTWNTTGFAKGNYTVWAYATPVPGETDTTDNTLTDGWAVVTIPGDVNGDYYVEIYDIVKICVAYNTQQGDPLYKPNLDMDGDGDIDIYDVVIACVHYGQTDP